MISSMRRWRCLGRPALEAEKLVSSHASACSLQRPAGCNCAAVVKRMMTSVKTWMQPCVACKHSQARYVCCEQARLMPSVTAQCPCCCILLQQVQAGRSEPAGC